jgi:hypothetical protein
MGLTALIYSWSLPVYLLLGPVFRVRNSPFAPEVLFSLPRFAVPLSTDDYNRFFVILFLQRSANRRHKAIIRRSLRNVEN